MTAAPLPASLFHAAPLHRLPCIIQDGALFPQSVLAGRHLSPRPTAARRDRMLGLADYVHLSLSSRTPLLAHKMAKGYPHAVLVFDRAAVLALPGVALLPFNTKAWRDKASFAPVTDPEAQASLLRDHAERGRCPSLEALVPYGLGLDILTRLVFFNDSECESLRAVLEAASLRPPAPLCAAPWLFPGGAGYAPTTLPAHLAYFAACCEARSVLPPPEIVFD